MNRDLGVSACGVCHVPCVLRPLRDQDKIVEKYEANSLLDFTFCGAAF